MAYIVHNIERTMDHWIKVMGVGPFFYLKDHTAAGATYRGRATDMRISLAFAQSGSMQIEIIQQHNDAASLFKDFLDFGREGLQHVAFWTQHFDEDMVRYGKMGYEAVQTAGLSGSTNRNAFIEKAGSADVALAIEISEISGTKGKFFRNIAVAAEGWDGNDPIREVTGGLR
jgi:hypothetical protein